MDVLNHQLLHYIICSPFDWLVTVSCDLPQVSTYSEDFQSERSDRERAQGEIDQLKSETETLRHVIQIMVRVCVYKAFGILSVC